MTPGSIAAVSYGRSLTAWEENGTVTSFPLLAMEVRPMDMQRVKTGSLRPLFATTIAANPFAPAVMCFVRFRDATETLRSMSCTRPRLVSQPDGAFLTVEPSPTMSADMYARLIPGGCPREIPIECIVEAWVLPSGKRTVTDGECPNG